MLTWNDLTEREPRLVELLMDIKRVKDDKTKRSFCANRVWYQDFKPRLIEIVGWYSEKDDPMLRTQEAYDIAYDHLYSRLPSCRSCFCL